MNGDVGQVREDGSHGRPRQGVVRGYRSIPGLNKTVSKMVMPVMGLTMVMVLVRAMKLWIEVTMWMTNCQNL